MDFGGLIDKLANNLERLKTIGIIVIGIFFIVSLSQNGCNRNEMERVVEKLTGLNIQNDILRSDIKYQDSILNAKNDSIQILKSEITSSKRKSNQLISENNAIKDKYDNLAEMLLQTTTDESYSFLDSIAYPYKGEKKYPFNEPQVRGMHRTYLENQSLIALNDNLQEQKDELVHQITLHDELSIETSSSMAIMKKKEKDLEKIVENKDEEIKLKDQQLKKNKIKNIFTITGAVIVAFLAGFATG